MRVGLLSLQHESNTFVHSRTRLADFETNILAVGDAIPAVAGESHHEVGGFLAGVESAGLEPVPLVYAWTTPSGTIERDTADRLVDLALRELDAAGHLDGLLVAPHGAAVSESERDFDGHWLTRVRQRLGADVPMICTLDPHANISPRMIEACDATITYRTNPHVDQRDVGLAAADLMARTLRGEVRPTQALVQPGVAISIDKQETEAQPCADLYALANDIQQRPGVLSDSVGLGFPYADVEEMGSSFIVVTDNDRDLAGRYAGELSAWLRAHHERFACDLPGVDAAITDAVAETVRVCLLDVGDNIGGGSPADGTVLAHALHERRVADSFVCLFDPDAAEQARSAGVGATLELRMGGKTDDMHGEPLTASVIVRQLHDGPFSETEPRHGGRTQYDMGPTAVVETDAGLTIMLNSKRTPPFSLQQLVAAGLDPERFHVLVAKGVNAPIAAYRTVCDRFIRVNTPGVTGADMTRFPYRHRPAPLYPFEALAEA